VAANIAYHSILYTIHIEERRWWFKSIWEVNILVKMIFFMWLCLNDCIILGVNYKKRGGISPFVCCLYLRNEETTTHIFVDCSKTQNIWSEVIKLFNIEGE
jgi:hypothetical protein